MGFTSGPGTPGYGPGQPGYVDPNDPEQSTHAFFGGDTWDASANMPTPTAGTYGGPGADPNDSGGTYGGSLGTGAYAPGGNGAGGAIGFEGQPGMSYFGGTPSAAAAATDYYVGQANNAMGQQAPTINQGASNAAQQAFYSQGIGAQQNATNLLGQTAAGGGPAQAAAQAQLQQGTDASIRSNLALANSTRGQQGLANAQKQAMTANAGATQAQGEQAAQLRASMAAQAQGQYAGAAGALGSNLLGEQGQAANEAQAQAALQEEQNKTNNATGLAYQQYGLNAQQGALGASEYNEGIAAGVNENNANNGANLTGSAIGAGAMALAAFADVKMKEPGGSSGWTIREEPDFLLARNDRTGELRKLATEPLSHDEHRQAMAPHGAGPIGQGTGRTVGDLDVSDGTGGTLDPSVTTAINGDGRQPTSMGGSLGAGAQPGALDAAANNTASIGGAGYDGGDPSALVGPGSDPGALPVNQVDPTMGGSLGTNAAAKSFAQPAGTAPGGGAQKSKLSQAFKGIGQQFLNRARVQQPVIGGNQMAQSAANYLGRSG